MLSRNIQSLIVSDSQLRQDLRMVSFDIWGTKAHVCMLRECSIISAAHASTILKALSEIDARCSAGQFAIDPQRGAQLSLESAVIDLAGEEAGLSMHTARSRNDQVMVTEILYLREECLNALESCLSAMQSILALGQKHITTVMPGYTHMQPGKPTTVGQWCLAYFDSLERGCSTLVNAYEQYNANPLGAVESFGTSWPINREMTSQLLAFPRTWEVTLDAVSSRGFYQLAILSALSQIALSMGKMSTDLLLYSTHEYGMTILGDDVARRLHPITGSSVMAQKRNPDALELIRSVAPQLCGMVQTVSGLISTLPSGYNRDTREIKEFVAIGIEKSMAGLAALKTVFDSLGFDEKRMLDVVQSNFSMTTDLADYIAQQSKRPYRLIYKVVGGFVDELIKNGTALNRASVASLNSALNSAGVDFSLTEEEYASAIEPHLALEKRVHTGGTASTELARLYSLRLLALAQKGEWLAAQRASINSGRDRTQTVVKAICCS